MSFEFVPTPENLRQEELIIQLADRLKLINSYSETLFEHIDDKLKDVQEKLEDINRRSELCAHKITQLKDEKKAITLYSHSKYPSREIKVNDFYKSFMINHSLEQKNEASSKQINSTHIPYDDDAKMKSQFYIYDKQINKHSISDHLSESNIPWQHISSLSSLLLFNSSENAYVYTNNYARGLRVASKKPQKSTNDTNDDSELQKTETCDENLDFQLTFHSAPQILNDLPTELPSLPGIADEFNFEESTEIDYADVSKLNLPDLALLSKVAYAPSPSSSSSSNIFHKDHSESPNLIVEELPKLAITENGLASPPLIPPPPPPPPPTIPPPPPPLPPPSLLEPEPKPEAKKTEAPSISSQDNSRASLLASIRAAGGKPKKKTIKELKHDEKLKKKDAEDAFVDQQTSTNVDSSNNKAASGGLDMMAELRKRLESRRSGISSDQTNKSTSYKQENHLSAKQTSTTLNPSSAMANISALIPPPPSVSDDEQEEDNNFEDWD